MTPEQAEAAIAKRAVELVLAHKMTVDAAVTQAIDEYLKALKPKGST